MKARERTHATAAESGETSDQGQRESGDNYKQEEEFKDPCEMQEQVSQLPSREADSTAVEIGNDDGKQTRDVRRQGFQDQAGYEDVITFRANHRGRQGHLMVSSQGLRFVVKSSHYSLSLNPKKIRRSREELWSYPFSSLVQMTKQNSSISSKVTGGDTSLKRLELEVLIPPTAANGDRDGDNLIRPFSAPSYPGGGGGGGESPEKGDPYIYAGKRGRTTRLETLDVDHAERDEIFNLIVGWSKARWQVLTTRSEAKAETKRKGKSKRGREEQ